MFSSNGISASDQTLEALAANEDGVRISDWDNAGEVVELVGKLLGILAILCLIGCWFVAIEYLPQYGRCCGEGGERFSTPSDFFMIASIMLFPLFMIAGFIVGLFTGYAMLSVATVLLILGWILLSIYAKELEREIVERLLREDKEQVQSRKKQS